MIYSFTFLTILIFQVFSRYLNQVLTVLVVALLTVLASIRYETGTDFKVYENVWKQHPNIAELSFNEIKNGFFEPLFTTSNGLLKLFTDSSTAFFGLYACLSLLPFIYALRPYKINQSYSLLLYFCVFYLPYTFNGMRQSIIMTFFIISIPYIIEGKIKKVLMWTFLSIGFHSSGILIFLSYGFFRITEYFKLRKWVLFSACVLVGGLLGVSGAIGALIFTIYPELEAPYSLLRIEKITFQNYFIRIFLGLIMLAGLLLGKGPSYRVEQIFSIYCFGLVLYLALGENAVMATRINMTFRILEIIIFPMIAVRLSGFTRVAYQVLTISIGVIFLMAVLQDPDYQYKINF